MPRCSLKWAFSPRLHPPPANVFGISVSSLTSRMPLHVFVIHCVGFRISTLWSFCFTKSVAFSLPPCVSLRSEHFWFHLFLLFVSISFLFCSHTSLQENQLGKHPLQSNTLLHTWHLWIEDILGVLQFLFHRSPKHHCEDSRLIHRWANFPRPLSTAMQVLMMAVVAC